MEGNTMFRKMSLIITLLIITLSMQAKLSWSENYTFRYTRWGMTPEEVIASETKLEPIEKSENLIKYKTQVLDKNVELVYQFVQNKLIGSSYRLNDNYLVSKRFIYSYNKFREKLIQKYGPAQKDETIWSNDIYRNISSKRGLALSLGHVEYLATWETPETMINCALKEVNYYVNCSVNYWSKEFSALKEEFNKEDNLDPF